MNGFKETFLSFFCDNEGYFNQLYGLWYTYMNVWQFAILQRLYYHSSWDQDR